MVSLDHYLRAVTLSSNLKRERKNLCFGAEKCPIQIYDALQSSTSILKNYGSAVHEWNIQYNFDYLLTATRQFEQPANDLVYSLSEVVNGNISSNILTAIFEKKPENSALLPNVIGEHITLSFRAIKEEIDQKIEYQKLLRIFGGFEFQNSQHLSALLQYIDSQIINAIRTCEELISQYLRE